MVLFQTALRRSLTLQMMLLRRSLDQVSAHFADGVVSDSTQPNACPANATIAAVIQADPSLAAGVVSDNTQTEALTQADAFSPQR
jgi:hypothetical protein